LAGLLLPVGAYCRLPLTDIHPVVSEAYRRWYPGGVDRRAGRVFSMIPSSKRLVTHA
jgi:hypothetical protein